MCISSILSQHLPRSLTQNFYFVIQKKKICFLIALGHLMTVLYQLAIAIYLQGLLPPANTICGSHEHISPASASEYHQN